MCFATRGFGVFDCRLELVRPREAQVQEFFLLMLEVSRAKFTSPNIYCKTRWKKNVNLNHLISQAWHLIRPEGRGEPWHELEARGRQALPNASVKTLTHKSDDT